MAAHRTLEAAAALARLPQPDGRRYVEVFRHGSLSVEMYAPRGHDPQQPHARDEIYVVVAGTGEFVCGASRTRFAAGDLLFVAAGAAHRFEAFSDDFAAWVMFYGPDGGETATGAD
jgi:mannose-6-phosphate isomerase-like protein (cupin superfamily)